MAVEERRSPPAPEVPPRLERWLFAAVLLATLGVLLILAWPFLAGRIYVFDDLACFHLPVRAFYAQCLAQGDSFLWMPQIHCGIYLQGEGQAGMAHPLHGALYRALPLIPAFAVEMLLSYPFMIAGMFLFLRRWRLPAYAALLGGSLFAFSSSNLLHYHHLNMVAVVAHIPWLLFALDAALRSANARARAWARLGLAALVASQVLLAHPQAMWWTALVLIGYTLLLGRRVWTWRGLAGVAAAGAAGLLLGAAQLLPTLDWLRHSDRPQFDLTRLGEWSLPPGRLLEFFAPGLHQHGHPEWGVYAGLGAVLLGLVALWRGRATEHRRLTLGACGLAAFGILYAIGWRGPVFWLFLHVPVVGLFRCPSRGMFLCHLGLAVLGAVGITELVRLAVSSTRPSRRALCWLLLPAAGSCSIVAWALLRTNAPGPEAWTDSMAPFGWAVGSVSVLTALALGAACRRRALLVALAAFAVIDPALYGVWVIGRNPPMRPAELMRKIVVPPNLAPHRLFLGDNTSVHALKGALLSNGYSGMQPRRLVYRDGASGDLLPFEQGPVFLRLAGVQWVKDGLLVPPWLQRLPKTNGYGWRLDDPLPRARLVARAVMSADPARDAQTTDIAATALVEERLDLPAGEPGRAEIVRERPGHLLARTQSETRQLLVLSERYHPGWRVEIDGRPGGLLRAYGVFLAVPVEAGAHAVEFRFEPKSWRYGLLLSAVGGLAALGPFGLALFLIRRKERRHG